MDSAGFQRSLHGATPPDGLDAALRALWWDAKGDWNGAHAAAQSANTPQACAVLHAYLHRKEGDLANARYWYTRAGKPPAAGSLELEWRALVGALCGRGESQNGH